MSSSSAPDLCPLPLAPRLLPKAWGGRRLLDWGKRLPEGVGVGESWEVFDDAQGSSEVAAGPAKGRSLAELRRLWGAASLGGSDKPGRESAFPLLFKLLDARENLSVQVHPDDALAVRLHGDGERGKHEAWVVLEAVPGAVLYNGLKPGTLWPEVEAALARGRVSELLNAVPVKAGDVVDVPAGRAHALGAGIVVAEAQQNCDRTYRLWDWNRLEHGRPRALHPEEARQALRLDAVGWGDGKVAAKPEPTAWGARESLIGNPHFRLERWTLGPGAGPSGAGPLWMLMGTAGSSLLRWKGQGAEADLALTPGAVVVVPAGLDVDLRARDAGAVVLAFGAA